ncbi:hypothetical protein PFICI_00731 [Pestalotiopsis fici W106-1]|uniref:Heterokaryon incompatibility domain-containing protein n=1 Tax=Pestalotiopsis fici (strain W106-1 / CGMCC3.15140) TaxID=1229662 RepID=W3XLF7_PESFW|nr:uncharacterized protein PFICI_00731 [Pestalotiopsis fici W106-1]ETS86903.1 hypothetical protein PFICI_00731 [Pestalotiopsis fici W106-1]
MAYSALEPQHIRVLKLEPSAERDAIITCSLSVISLSENPTPQYEALSYVWGDFTERHEIQLDGLPTPVTMNLWTALRYIRLPDAPRTLWIDAVCINQSDVQERNAQVRQMGRIYSQASHVLIWLGDPDPQIEDTFSALSVPGALDQRQYEDFPPEIADGLRKMLARPWWHRVWVLQEHVLADADPAVGCGDSWLDWKELSGALLDFARSMMDASGTTIADDQTTWVQDSTMLLRHVLLREQWNDPGYQGGRGTTIAEIIERTRGRRATDKRDQVFAVSGLLREEDKAMFPAPDYAMSVNEVYQMATVAFIRSSAKLTFLIHATDKGDDDLELPSWCVDFSKRMWDWGAYGNLGGHDFGHRRESEEEIQEFMNVLSHDASLGTLNVLGGVLGQVIMSRPLVPPSAFDQSGVTVQFEGEPRPMMEAGVGKLLMLTEFVKEVLRMTTISHTIWEQRDGAQAAKEMIAAGQVWETLFGGILFNIVDAVCIRTGIETVDGDDRPREYWVIEAFIRKICPWYANAIEKFGFLHPTPQLAESARLERALWETMMLTTQINIGKYWFGTDTGYIGCVDRELEASDQLCTILGCEGPFILRSTNDAFKLIALPQSRDFVQDHHRTRVREVEREVFTLR